MNFSSQGKQLQIDVFRSSLEGLNKSNRWVQLGDTLPWDEIEQLYNKRLNNGKRGAGNKPARMIIGALVVKHKMNLSDEETILAIQENPYMQYFVGLSEFTDKPIFDSSLFVSICKRLSTADFNDISVSLLTLQVEKARAASKATPEDKDQSNNDSGASASNNTFTDSQGRYHEGALKIDATCSDAEVRYPTDIDLLHDGCKVINRYIDKLCKRFSLVHPYTHYKPARRAYLEVIKRKKKSKSLINRGMSQLLTYLIRDMRSFIGLIAANGTHSCTDRIISIFQSHIRPIVRGKAKTPTEFGAKIGASIVEGYTFVDHHCWNAYNESSDLPVQIELYWQCFGFLPAKVYADKIYLNKTNRKLMKEMEIQAVGKPLGRPPRESRTVEYQAQLVNAGGERNEIEATFGTGKRIYRANNIWAKLPETANCWTGMCYFVKNVKKFLRELLHALIFVINLLANHGSIWRKVTPLPRFAYCGILKG